MKLFLKELLAHICAKRSSIQCPMSKKLRQSPQKILIFSTELQILLMNSLILTIPMLSDVRIDLHPDNKWIRLTDQYYKFIFHKNNKHL